MKDVITITREEYKKAFAKVLEGDFVSRITKEEPVMFVAFLPIGMEIEKVLFAEDEDKERGKHE